MSTQSAIQPTDASRVRVLSLQERSWRVKWRDALIAYAFILPYGLFFLTFLLGPMIFAIGLSFSEWELLYNTREFIGLQNYIELFQDSLFWISFFNSFYFAILTVIGNLIVPLAAAVALRGILRGQTFFRIILYVPTILSISVMGIIMQRVLNTNGLLNYFLALIGIKPLRFLGETILVMPSLSLATVWWTLGFPMLIFLSGLYAIPNSLYEAAQLDGANAWRRFTRITLPLLRPTLLLVLVTQFIGHMQVFGQPYILTQGGPGYASYPLILYLYQTAWRYYHMGYAAAMAIMLALFMLGVSLLQFRVLGRRVEY
ncbi:sugar ABC transporter permease [Chloroflexi bacterium TSY]|nr:sugar ABC transporter permease [Chloroflexi bacterium TSY]